MDNNWNGESFPKVGQMVLTYGNNQFPVLAIDDEGTICLNGKKRGLFTLSKGFYFAIPNLAEVEKQKYISKITASVNACLPRGVSTGESVYMDGYRKVKPLIFNDFVDFMTIPTNIAKYNYLVEKGYCIGSAD